MAKSHGRRVNALYFDLSDSRETQKPRRRSTENSKWHAHVGQYVDHKRVGTTWIPEGTVFKPSVLSLVATFSPYFLLFFDILWRWSPDFEEDVRMRYNDRIGQLANICLFVFLGIYCYSQAGMIFSVGWGTAILLREPSHIFREIFNKRSRRRGERRVTVPRTGLYVVSPE